MKVPPSPVLLDFWKRLGADGEEICPMCGWGMDVDIGGEKKGDRAARE